jgi:hypothetical protein
MSFDPSPSSTLQEIVKLYEIKPTTNLSLTVTEVGEKPKLELFRVDENFITSLKEFIQKFNSGLSGKFEFRIPHPTAIGFFNDYKIVSAETKNPQTGVVEKVNGGNVPAFETNWGNKTDAKPFIQRIRIGYEKYKFAQTRGLKVPEIKEIKQVNTTAAPLDHDYNPNGYSLGEKSIARDPDTAQPQTQLYVASTTGSTLDHQPVYDIRGGGKTPRRRRRGSKKSQKSRRRNNRKR